MMKILDRIVFWCVLLIWLVFLLLSPLLLSWVIVEFLWDDPVMGMFIPIAMFLMIVFLGGGIASHYAYIERYKGARAVWTMSLSERLEKLRNSSLDVKIIFYPPQIIACLFLSFFHYLLLPFFHCLWLIVSYPVREVQKCIDEDIFWGKVNFFTVSRAMIKRVFNFFRNIFNCEGTDLECFFTISFPLTINFIFNRSKWNSVYSWCLNIQIILVLLIFDLPWFCLLWTFAGIWGFLFNVAPGIFANFRSMAKTALFIVLAIVVIWSIAYMAAPEKTAEFTYKTSVMCRVPPATIDKVAGAFKYVFGDHHSPAQEDDSYGASANTANNYSKTFNEYKDKTIGFFKKLFGQDTGSRHQTAPARRTNNLLSTSNTDSYSSESSSSSASSSSSYYSSNYSNTYYSTYSPVYVGEFQVYNDTQQNMFYWMQETSNNIKSGDYNRAIACAQYNLRAGCEYFASTDATEASDHLTLAMLWWSVGERSNAIEEMEKMISTLKNGRYTGGSGCEARAEIFLQKMRSGNLPSRFAPGDIGGYLHNFIMEVPYAAQSRTLHKISARYEAIGNMAAAATDVYRSQGRAQAMMAKHYASSEYQKYTGRTFSPDDPPAYGTKDRERWEGVKRIYDIFN